MIAGLVVAYWVGFAVALGMAMGGHPDEKPPRWRDVLPIACLSWIGVGMAVGCWFTSVEERLTELTKVFK